jgi:hypothetical protein
MKYLLALLLVTFSLCQPVFADVYVAKNSAGGEIVLTSNKCPFEGGENMRYAYSTEITAQIIMRGCWNIFDGVHILVFWMMENKVNPKEYHIKNFLLKKSI